MLTISKAAASAQVSADALRYYEREGLIAPASKSDAGYRLYSEQSVRRVRFIKHAQQCGFTLSEIRELLAVKEAESACCSDVRSLAIEKKLQLEAKIRTLQTMSHALDELVSKCVDAEKPVESCPILSTLENAIYGR